MPRTKTKTVPIKVKRSRAHGNYDMIAWTRSPPFAVNPRGVLTHRVRHVVTILYCMKERHHHIDHLCGNGCNVDLDAIDDALVADPPKDRLLCQRCEEVARRHELPSGDQLAGRHVHRGVLVPQQTCCGGK